MVIVSRLFLQPTPNHARSATHDRGKDSEIRRECAQGMASYECFNFKRTLHGTFLDVNMIALGGVLPVYCRRSVKLKSNEGSLQDGSLTRYLVEQSKCLSFPFSGVTAQDLDAVGYRAMWFANRQ